MVFTRSERRLWLLFAFITMVLAVVPLFFVQFPPATDLPQHLSQLRLFGDFWRHDDGTYAINWLWPNTLVYALIAPAWLFLSPDLAARGALFFIIWASIGGTFLLSACRRRPLESSILITPLFFSHVFYWGFLNFEIGWFAFAI